MSTGLSAVQHIRRMRGGAQSHLMRSSDGNFFVVKFANNPQHVRVLANEMFASRLGQWLGLPIPRVEVIEASDWLITNTPDLRVEVGGSAVPCSSGKQLASLYPPLETQVFDYLPESMLESHFKIPLDRFIGEPLENHSLCKAHLISVAGGDTQIAAVSAAIANREWFSVETPDGSTFRVTLGANAQSYRGSVNVEGSKYPLRHLVAVSEELSQIGTGKTTERVILLDDSPDFVWKSLAQVHGVPGVCEWADWFLGELTRLKAIEPLLGIGCRPVLVKGAKGMFMNCISRGLRSGKLQFPQSNGPVYWDRHSFKQLLTPEIA